MVAMVVLEETVVVIKGFSDNFSGSFLCAVRCNKHYRNLMFSLGILISLMLSGCVHNPPTSDFDRVESFVKPIDTGLYFIREVDSKGVFTEKEKPIDAWKAQAQSICPSGYDTLFLSDEDLGRFVLAQPGSLYMNCIDGIVLCDTSPLTKKEATQVLIDDYYIIPK